jgi:two-component system cell cycle response regulator
VVVVGSGLRTALADFEVIQASSAAEVETYAGTGVPLLIDLTDELAAAQFESLLDVLEGAMPVLAITSDDGPSIARAFASGADDVARSSGLTVDELRARLLALVRRHRMEQSWKALRGRLSGDKRIDSDSGLLTWEGASEYVERDLSWARRYGRSVALLFVVVDPEVAGVECDETVLVRIAKFLKDMVRETDMVARYEHCEFVVVAPETDDRAAMAIGKRALSVKDLVDSSKEFRVSVGTACSRAVDVASAADLLRVAISAVERARRSGGNCVESMCGESHE